MLKFGQSTSTTRNALPSSEAFSHSRTPLSASSRANLKAVLMLRIIVAGAVVLAGYAAIRAWHLAQRMETIMADFTALKDAHTALKTEVTAVADRFTAKVEELNTRISALELDTADNAEITGLTGELTADAEQLRQIGASPTPDPEPTPEPLPVEPNQPV